MSIKRFHNFRVEELFNFKKRHGLPGDLPQLNKIDICVKEILSFLKENEISDWNDFISSGKFDRFVIDKLIDSSCENDEEVNEVKFKLRLSLCNENQLKKMLKEFEKSEEFEKCCDILKEIENRKFV